MSVLGFATLVFCLLVAFCMSASMSKASTLKKPMRILVFGGTGFVGSQFVKTAAQRGHEVVALARRAPDFPLPPNVKYISCNAVNLEEIEKALSKETNFDACVHAIGLLFDSSSKLRDYNKFMSGSGSIPSNDATYDQITRQTAFNALSVFTKKKRSTTIPKFLFVSAAEAGWTFKAPVDFLERYLVAKRAVETKLLSLIPPSNNNNQKITIRPVIFRPSLIWSSQRPQSFLSVLPFFVGYFLRFSFVDRPVTVEALTSAMVTAIEQEDQEIIGIQRFPEIDRLSAAQ
jgi:hypothetical protein